jgi:pantoate--beta-alanine ligase
LQGSAEVLTTREQMRLKSLELIQKGQSIGFVPTMGALHAGHGELLRRARQENSVVVLSIFVNPKQFGPQEDLSKYPRTLLKDVDLAKSHGVDYVFAPTIDEMYPLPFLTQVSVNEKMTKILCGQYRDNHFDGVCTVVLLLLNLVGAHRSYFGLKDFQQFTILRKMCKDLAMSTEMIGIPTVRSESGLALSSRNQFLSESEASQALAIPKALALLWQAYEKDAVTVRELKTLALSKLQEAGIKAQYFECREIDTLQVIEDSTVLENHDDRSTEALFAFAGFMGQTRLIDNVVLSHQPVYQLAGKELMRLSLAREIDS